ncbi:sporulation protein, YlmC/YmxH family [Desulfotomaculum arcticum]|uniref:Sporulation protein, YlmC/YmxH family n=1 Tax=Desulfotruncus arcticus DSM 17038 TaxID=1121424 RepID=A0A1I2S8Q7_9FIRM|nr:YlmC/YmxH family sporulation protein [Desulfotruncus arcticus]SFG49130.1 sporulation protein, YlmC/YmxH family [Desulfotomaculum arcticum] [Desulfotruncus arcticus DSM 17038]
MRLGELAGKEIINVSDGARLGVVGDTDLNVDATTGAIISIILPRKGNLLNLWAERHELVIPWESVKKIGMEVILVELDQATPKFGKYLV